MKAISLLSGGLDSEIATRIVLQQGIEVIGVSFVTPFLSTERKNSFKDKIIEVGKNLNIEVKIIPIEDEYLEIVKNPKYGYGKNLNPCIDCKILMLKYAKKIMNDISAQFVITGEVLGQRPKSQNINALFTIEKEAGLEGLILRPLSAKLLPPSIPEKLAWVDRNKLYAITGRQRKLQIELVKSFGMVKYPAVSGGCLLTDVNFSKKIKDIITYTKNLTIFDINLAKIGRHFRIDPYTKVVIGRNEKENQQLISLKRDSDVLFQPLDIPGPTGLGVGEFSEDKLLFFASIVATYCDGDQTNVKVLDATNNKIIVAKRLNKKELERLRI
ncbi:MAG: hypothetical protein NZ839_01225 [Endomicrobia bacterium]|nr:hypothetical protein [Endomicrobiia bacterium]MCX7716637.1 hypothetical protein [Endomicrobiia bacterium]